MHTAQHDDDDDLLYILDTAAIMYVLKHKESIFLKYTSFIKIQGVDEKF